MNAFISFKTPINGVFFSYTPYFMYFCRTLAVEDTINKALELTSFNSEFIAKTFYEL